MPLQERHSIIIIINGLTVMKGNASSGPIVDLIANVQAADAIVDANWTAISHSTGTIQQMQLHKLLGFTQVLVEHGTPYIIDGTDHDTNGAVSASINALNTEIAAQL